MLPNVMYQKEKDLEQVLTEKKLSTNIRKGKMEKGRKFNQKNSLQSLKLTLFTQNKKPK